VLALLLVLTSFETFGQLYRDRSLTPKQVGERLMAMTRGTLYKPNVSGGINRER